jgi:hypothetical protein
MGAHDAKDLILDSPKCHEEASRESTLPILAVDDKLGYPADLPALVVPPAGKCISGKGVVDMNTDIRPAGVSRQILAP